MDVLQTSRTARETGIAMSYQDWKEKRQYKRYASDLPVRYRELNGSEGAFAEGTILNISRGGVFVATKSPPAAGTEIEIVMNVKTPFGEEREMQARAKVMWSSDRKDEEGMGLSFTDIDRHTQYAMLACAYRGEG